MQKVLMDVSVKQQCKFRLYNTDLWMSEFDLLS